MALTGILFSMFGLQSAAIVQKLYLQIWKTRFVDIFVI